MEETLTILTTERLSLRTLSAEDAGFMLRLLNEPSFIQHIGDKGVRTEEDARAYLANGPLTSYERHGFGLWLVEERESGAAAGVCGLLKRETLEDVDIGYAFVPEFWSRGYASEAAAAVLAYGRSALGLRRIVAVVNADNQSSIRLLEKLGFVYERMVALSDGGPEVKLFASADKRSDE
jgi:RimJ/RimL family protein N-acetyltransferase